MSTPASNSAEPTSTPLPGDWPRSSPARSPSVRLIPALLFLATLAAFARVIHCDFINVDDDVYVFANPHVSTGVSWDNLHWAFTTFHASNWHPLTWLSLMADANLSAVFSSPGHPALVYHLTNLILHAANALILYNLLRAFTGAPWRSALVAGFFAIHPLRVESVAWVAERKDVLSACLGLLCLRAYVSYARAPSLMRYLLVASLLALSLLAKPMLVTLPCLLLLLDFWPLGRLKLPRGLGHSESGKGPSLADTQAGLSTSLLRLVLEKLPLLALALGSCVVTYMAQKAGGAMRSGEVVSMSQRLTNIPFAYGQYLVKLVWFESLSIEYPYPDHLSGLEIAVSTAGLLLMTGVAIALVRTRPHLAVGWFWFVGSLVPVIGLIQVGNQPMADRYTYVPGIGLAIMLAWSLPRWQGPARVAVVAGCVAGIIALVGFTRRQVDYWADSVTLMTHAIEVTGGSYLAENNLGAALNNRGDPLGASKHFGRAAKLRPKSATALNNYAFALANAGQQTEALRQFEAALALDPNLAVAHSNMAALLLRIGDDEKAEEHLRLAIKVKPGDDGLLLSLGSLLLQRGKAQESIELHQQILKSNPDHADAQFNLGLAFLSLGDRAEAMKHFQAAVQLQPKSAKFLRKIAELNSIAPISGQSP